jgi:hypothetical protein
VWNDDGAVLDWVNLPAGLEPELLWDSMHDAKLSSMRSNLLERAITIAVSECSFLEFHKLPLDLSIELELSNVQAARVVSWTIWPGPKPDLTGVSYKESNRLVAEYRAKWREQSVSWTDFEERIATETKPIVVIDAELARSEGSGVAFRSAVMTKDGDYFEMFLRAAQLSVARSDGEAFDLEALKNLGATYWRDRSKDRK